MRAQQKILFSIIAFVICISMTGGSLCGQTAPVLTPNGTVNAADYTRSFAPGAIVSIFGTNLATKLAQAAELPLPTSLDGTSVEIVDGTKTTLAGLYMVSAGQINAMLPYDVGASVKVRVRSTSGVSAEDTIAVAPRAPRLFAVDQSGLGRAVSTHPDGKYLSRELPGKPGAPATLWLNSMGAVDPPIAAGVSVEPKPLRNVSEPVTMTINNKPAPVDFAGLVPYLTGLYQINYRLPFDEVVGDVPIRVTVGQASSQTNISVPVEPNGFYWVYTGGKFVNGQTLNGIAGANCAIAYWHNDKDVLGQSGYLAWAKEVAFGADGTATSGLALTLRDGDSIVYDNNGIETGSDAGYYDGSAGTAGKPGMTVFLSMSKNANVVTAGFFRLAARTTITQVTGYFDGNGDSELRFDPASPFNMWRMNIWSNAAGNVPSNLKPFTGDKFSSDTQAGKFSISDTGAKRLFPGGISDSIFRLTYTLAAPLTLDAGDYWFSHDLAPGDSTASAKSTAPPAAQGESQAQRVRRDSVLRLIP